MIYCDTSLVVTALTGEPTTVEAQRWLAEPPEALCVSLWVETEVASALAQKQRSGTLTAATRKMAFALWRKLSSNWRLLPIEAPQFTAAGDLTRHGLRAGDALHLAIVVEHGAALATRDHDLARVAQELGVVTYRLG